MQDVADSPSSDPSDEMRVAIERLLSVTGASYERAAQLESALSSRIVIEQAKGILAERFRLSVGEAFDLLRGAARAHRLKVKELAVAVVSAPETPAEIVAMLPQVLGHAGPRSAA